MNILPQANISSQPPSFFSGYTSDIKLTIYEYLLADCLDLDQSDVRAISKHYNLNPNQAYLRGYRSAYTPDGSRLVIEHELDQQFNNLPSLAGFYHDDGLRLNWPSYGVFVPCRFRGKIRALAIYPNPKEPKFYWWTSRNFLNGCAAEPSVHVAGYFYAKQTRVAALVPHIIAADAFALQNHVCAVAANNINPNKIARQLREALPFVRRVIVSNDCASQSLRQALSSQSFQIIEELKDENVIVA